MPTDYVSAANIKHPREAIRAFAERWREQARLMASEERAPGIQIGRPEDWPSLSPLLNSRASMLLEWVNDDALWKHLDRSEFGGGLDDSDLHFAAQDGDMARVRELLAEGRSPNAFDEISKTPLHYAATSGHLDIMRVLVEAGADVNANDEPRIGNTALRDVADECSLAVARFLVDSGADPRIPGWMQLTALHKAEQRKDEEGQRVYALLKSVADRLGDF